MSIQSIYVNVNICQYIPIQNIYQHMSMYVSQFMSICNFQVWVIGRSLVMLNHRSLSYSGILYWKNVDFGTWDGFQYNLSPT